MALSRTSINVSILQTQGDSVVPDTMVFIIMQTAFSFLAIIEVQETEEEIVMVYEQRHPPPFVAALKGSVTESTWLSWQQTPN